MRQELKSVITSHYIGRIDKTKQIKDGATMLNRTQVKPTRNSKKIRGNDGNKSDSPHLRGKIFLLSRVNEKVVNKRKEIKTSKF